MRACGELVIGLDARGRSIASTIRGEAPLLMRVTEPAPLAVHLLGGAAGPLGGDELRMRVDIEAGAHATVRSVAATLVHPGPRGAPSTASTDATIAAGASLDWWPEPLVAIVGCDHSVRTRIAVEQGADVRWVDELVGGRHAESAGSIVLHQRVEQGGSPVLHHTVRPDWRPGARVVVTGGWVGPPSGASATVLNGRVRAGRYALGPTATAWVGIGDDLTAVRAALCELGLHR